LSWSREFDEPIVLPGGLSLITLRDAADYITGLPQKEAALPEWQAAIEALILVVEQNGPPMFALLPDEAVCSIRYLVVLVVELYACKLPL
jgi:hypothetical protein